MTNYKEHLKEITTFIFDYDGVLTDGQVLLLNEGDALRTANVKDGYAMHLAVKNGYNIAVISGGRSQSMENRFKPLGIIDVYIGVDNKLKVFNQYLKKKNIKPEQVLFMGDDIPDYEIMLEVGLPTCPADACTEIKAVSKYISNFDGGKGCVRDVIEQVLKLQGNWMNHVAFSW
jgi:3-deoxy-D-manno-octulosonate 8-phosphate phosphatase (KDO 8-P phosphatase)